MNPYTKLGVILSGAQDLSQPAFGTLYNPRAVSVDCELPRHLRDSG
jgi:hypothetical protein